MSGAVRDYNILVIEDEREIADIIKTYLQIYAPFHRVVIAENSLQANQKIINQKFDLIITDMQLGSRSAIEFIKKMRAHPKFYKIKFMVVSGCLTQDDTLALMRLGIRNILVKPFTARQILTNAISCLRIEKKPYKTVDRILEAVRDHFYEEESEDGFSDEELSDILDKSDSED